MAGRGWSGEALPKETKAVTGALAPLGGRNGYFFTNSGSRARRKTAGTPSTSAAARTEPLILTESARRISSAREAASSAGWTGSGSVAEGWKAKLDGPAPVVMVPDHVRGRDDFWRSVRMLATARS